MILLDNRQIHRSAVAAELISAMREAFSTAYDAPERMHCDLPASAGAKLLIMPAWQPSSDIGVKIATVIPANAARGLPTINGLFVMLDGQTGVPTAILDAPALTALRTAAVSALASQYLSRPDAQTLLLIGTGTLIPHLARAHAAVRPLQRILIWGRNLQKANAIARALSDLPCAVETVADLTSQLALADIISCATSSATPLVLGQRVSPGAHVDLVGSFTPQMREGDDALLTRGRLVVDTQTALSESGDLIEPLARGLIAAPALELRAVIAQPELGRRGREDVTVFKSVGTGLADIAAAQYFLRKYAAASDTLKSKSVADG